MNTAQKPNRRDLILDTALELFNEAGSGKVTTNHIAKAMGISPGNLYYYYQSKEHIIRELLKRLIVAFDTLISPQMANKSFLRVVSETMNAVCGLIFTYRFIYIELASLLARDREFAEMYRDIKVKRVQDFKQLFDSLAHMGILKQEVTPVEQEAMTFIIWTYAEGIITALHSSNIPITLESIQTHFRKIILILKPYLDPALWSVMTRQMDMP